MIQAHQIETMARQKRLLKLESYLSSDGRPQGTDDGVFAAFERAAAKGLVTIKERAA